MKYTESIKNEFTILNLLVYFIIFVSIEVFPQQEQFKFEHITIQQGLNNNQVYSIGQDKQGFMWFGTPSGLNRFDGYNIKVYSHIAHYGKSPIFEDDHGSLWMICEGGQIYRLNLATEKFKTYPSTGIRTFQLYKDSEGEIWAATIGDGLAKYIQSADSFIVYKHNVNDSNSISSDTVYSIFESSNKNIWIGTRNGLNLFDPQKLKFRHLNYIPRKHFVSINEDKNGILWLGTFLDGDGVYEVDKSLRTVKHYIEPSIAYSIYVDSENNLWIETGSGVSYFDRSTSDFIRSKNYLKYPEGGVSQHPIIEHNGIIWSIAQQRLAIFDKTKNDFVFLHYDPSNLYSINDDIFSQIFEDKTGNLWFGTNSGGVNFISNTGKPFYYFPKKLVTALYMDKSGTLWIGTQNGIFKAVKNNGRIGYKRITGIDDIIYQIAEDNSGHIWMAANNYLISLDKKSEKITFKYSNKYFNGNPMTNILIDKKGMIWIANYNQLLKYNPYKKTFAHFSKISSTGTPQVFYFLYEDHHSNIWAGPGELSVFNNDSLKPENYSKRPYLKNNNFRCMYEDSNNKMWFISSDDKLYMLDDSKGKLNDLTPGNYPVNEKILRIISDNNGELWLLRTKGISKYNPSTGNLKNYSADDGIVTPTSTPPSNPYCRGNKGEMYVGGNDGYVMFYPDSIKNNPNIPPVVITSFRIFNKEVKLDTAISKKKIITLPYSENSISFDFAALNYTSPQKNQYAYELEGFDKDWTYCGTRRNVSYTNLDHGSYIFRVKGSNNDGVWNEEGASIAIIISPPLWATWWAYSSYAFIFVFSLYGIRRYEMNRLRLKDKIKMDEAVLKEREETDKMKSRFFSNISHEFRTPLTLILGPAEKISSQNSTDVIKDSEIIKRNSKRLLQLVNQLLDLSKLEAGKLKLEASKGNIASFVKGIALSFESLSEEKDITLKIESEKEYIEVYYDKEKLIKILSNVLSNAFKFTPQDGKITVSITEKASSSVSSSLPGESRLNREKPGSSVEIKIRDTGIGIPKEEIPKLFDRFYQVDSSFTKEYEGTGIGLALTKELVELHYGSIFVESELGQFTEFTIILPLGKEHFKDEEIIEEKGIKEDVILSEAKNLTLRNDNNQKSSTLLDSSSETPQYGTAINEDKTIILIVEDNYDMREYIKESLDSSYKVEEAVNGEQGIRKAVKIIPDLIISDMMMPKMDGNELTRILKNDEKTSHIPVIILTAKSGHESKLEGLQTGADDYLTKPFDVKELQIRINNLIKIRRTLQEKYGKGEYILKHGEKKIRNIDEKFLEKILKITEVHISEEDFSIEELGDEIGMSRSQLFRKMKALTGKSPSVYVRSLRLIKAKKMIENGDGNISEIAYSVGFSSPVYFSTCFKEEFGFSPKDLTL